MTAATDKKIKNKKIHYDISRKTAKILALSSGETYKYQYLRCAKLLFSYQSRIIEKTNQSRIKEQAKFTYSSVEKVFEK